MLPAECKQGPYFFQSLGLHHCFRDQAIKTGVGSVGDKFDGTDEDATLADKSGELSLECPGKKAAGELLRPPP